jgi:hypothetical protein
MPHLRGGMPTAGTPVVQDSRDGYPPKIKFLEIILATAKKTAFLHTCASWIPAPHFLLPPLLHPSSFILSFFILHPFICPQPQPLSIEY